MVTKTSLAYGQSYSENTASLKSMSKDKHWQMLDIQYDHSKWY